MFQSRNQEREDMTTNKNWIKVIRRMFKDMDESFVSMNNTIKNC